MDAILGIIGLIILIVFFVMTSNIAAIKNNTSVIIKILKEIRDGKKEEK